MTGDGERRRSGQRPGGLDCAPLALALQRGLGRLRAHPLHGAHLHATGLVRTGPTDLAIYSVFCRQCPTMAYFLYGPDAAPYRTGTGRRRPPQGLDLFTQRKFIGNDLAGCKVALCHA
ncbi:MAG: hypothetical protein R3A10_06115 [Caldilineaceae bacterium]